MENENEKELEGIIDKLRYLIPCFQGDPCDYDNTCKNHQISWDIQRLFKKRGEEIDELKRDNETLRHNLSEEFKREDHRLKEAEKRFSSLMKAISEIKECGHNDDCLMCAMKDTIVNKTLDKAKEGK